ncbi:hypothetical protein [Allonocardiopsis opalescens]|uniref:Uncharacterized protein n=1 Tax=Allonocardiopsis opalescens TaxID=1144618 RepID=A0A2T0PSR8_9ACTN|nr:hypothetical protein [Allonocardiopsis opalescens]PRX91943.1 hypothetical protein CLV72_11216 [Allonocardiopsis opalescens]
MTITGIQQQRLMDLLNGFEGSLTEVATRRDERPDLETRHGRTEPGWVWFEAETMLRLLNNERTERGLPLASVRDVMRLESMAAGHVDYTKKYALYCAELAMGITPIRP